MEDNKFEIQEVPGRDGINQGMPTWVVFNRQTGIPATGYVHTNYAAARAQLIALTD